MNSAPRKSNAMRRKRYYIGCFTPMVVVLLGVLIRWQMQNVPDRQFLPPNPPLPHPNAADTFTKAARQCAHNGGTAKFLPKITVQWNTETDPASDRTPIRALRKLVRANRNALATFRKGLAQPCRYPNPPLEGPFNFIKEVDLAKVLIAEGRVYQADGQWRAAADSYLDAYEFGTRIAENKTYPVTSALIESMGMTLLDSVLNRCDPATAAHVGARLQSLLARNPRIADMLRMLELRSLTLVQRWGAGETKCSLGSLYCMNFELTSPVNLKYSPGSSFDNIFIETTLKAYYLLNKRDTQEQYRNCWEAIIADLKRPSYQRMPRFPRPSNFIALLGAPLYMSYPHGAECNQAKAQLLIIKAALKVYSVKHGVYPKTLAALHLKPALLADPFRKAPMVYAPPKGRGGKKSLFRLYSVGPNGKDDGGVVGKNELDLLPGRS